jgi:hypothetical protein
VNWDEKEGRTTAVAGYEPDEHGGRRRRTSQAKPSTNRGGNTNDNSDTMGDEGEASRWALSHHQLLISSDHDRWLRLRTESEDTTPHSIARGGGQAASHIIVLK